MLSFEGGKVLPYYCFSEEEKKTRFNGFFSPPRKNSNKVKLSLPQKKA